MYDKENKHPLFSLKQTLWAVVTYNQPNINRICIDNINNDNAVMMSSESHTLVYLPSQEMVK